MPSNLIFVAGIFVLSVAVIVGLGLFVISVVLEARHRHRKRLGRVGRKRMSGKLDLDDARMALLRHKEDTSVFVTLTDALSRFVPLLNTTRLRANIKRAGMKLSIGAFVINPAWGLWLGLGILAVGIAAGAVHRSFHGPTSEKLIKGVAVTVASFGAILALNNFMYVELTADWKKVGTMAELEAAIARAEEAGKPILIDFGASWCNPCHELESQTFAHPDVEAELAKYELIKIDVSDPSDEQQAMQSALDAQELPSVVVYGTDTRLSEHVETLRAGKPLPDPSVHVTTFVPADEFLARLAGSGVQTTVNICSRS